MDRVATSIDKEDASYAKRIQIKAPIELVFEVVSTLEGIGSWWDGPVSGDASEHGELRFAVADSDDRGPTRALCGRGAARLPPDARNDDATARVPPNRVAACQAW